MRLVLPFKTDRKKAVDAPTIAPTAVAKMNHFRTLMNMMVSSLSFSFITLTLLFKPVSENLKKLENCNYSVIPTCQNLTNLRMSKYMLRTIADAGRLCLDNLLIIAQTSC